MTTDLAGCGRETTAPGDIADHVLERFSRVHDIDARKALAEAVVDEFVSLMRAGADLGPILAAIEQLSTRPEVWAMLRPIAGPRLCRILSRSAVMAMESRGSSVDALRARLTSWMTEGTFDRNHIQNALKAIESHELAIRARQKAKASEFCFESARTVQKRRRCSSALRPKNEPDEAEFMEVWKRVCEWDGRIPHQGTVDFGLGCDVYRCEDVDSASDISVRHTICIWDLDETLILFNCLLDRERYRNRFPWTGSEEVAAIGESLCANVLTIADQHFFFNQIEDLDQEHISALNDHDDLALLDGYDFSADSLKSDNGSIDYRLVSYRFREIRARYRRSLDELVPTKTSHELAGALSEIDLLSGGWLSTARTVVQDSYGSSGCTNIIVSSGQLTPTLVKLIVFGLSSMFPIENIYSSRKSSKAAAFAQLLQRFGPHCTYQVLGDDHEEELACEVFSSSNVAYSFRPIRSVDDLTDSTDRLITPTLH